MSKVSKKGLIKLTEEDNIFYDSIQKVYRYRMHCPTCGKVSGCQCFESLEDAEYASISDLDYCCTYKCSVMAMAKYRDHEAENIMSALGMKKDIKDITENEARSIIFEMDLDAEYIGGESCKEIQ